MRKEPIISRELLWLSIGYFFLFFGASHQQFLVTYLRDTLGWGETIAQAALGTVYASFMVWRLLIVATLRPLGDYRSILLGSATYPLFVLIVWAASYALGAPWVVAGVFLIAALWGWGAASMWLTSGSYMLDGAKRSRYGMASGFFYAAPNLGFALGILVFDALLRRRGGDIDAQRTRLLYTALAMAVGWLCLTALPKHTVERKASLRDALRFMNHPRLRIGAFLMLSSSIGFGLMLSVFPNYIQEVSTVPLLSTAAFFPLARAVLSLTGSPFSDRWGRGPVLFVSFGIGAVGLGLAAFLPAAWTAAIAALMLGLQGGLIPPVATALVGDVARSEDRPFALGAVFFWRDFGVVLVFLVSITRALGGVAVTQRALMGGFAVLFLACAALSILLSRVERRAVG